MTAFRLFRSAPRSADTDAELLTRFAASHDETAFGELLNRHGPLVYRVCRRLLDASLADDAFQAAFLVLATRAHTVRKVASVGSWLIGVAGRVARQMRRRAVLRAPLRVAANSSPEPPAIETADLGRVLDEELTRLPDKLRAVVVACLVEERTQAEAARTLGESERTIRRRLLEARRLLRERLERRGVVPAVAGGLIAGLGGTAAAVPLRLSDNTLTVVFDFLAGGAAVASVPAALAKGVAMSGLRKTLAASVAVLALGLSALGVGLADDRPPASEAKTIPPQNIPLGDRQPAEPPKPPLSEPPLFVVSGGDELANRVVQREAEYAARKVAERWGVRPLPQLKEKWRIVLEIVPNRTTGATTFTYDSQPKRGVRSAEMQLTGSLEQILRTQLPHEITHCVLAAHFGRPLPRWADEGIAVMSESAKEQADHDRKVREFANDGRALRLKHLLPMTEYPRDLMVLYAQGHSVARFLYQSDAKKLLPMVEASFADGWDKALKATYGFADADALEEAWLGWLNMPGSVPKAQAKPLLQEYRIEPPDTLHLTFTPRTNRLPKDGEFQVRPDGTIGRGPNGAVRVTGLTVAEAAEAVRKELVQFDANVKVTVDVVAFKSKLFSVITDGEKGEQVTPLPATGNETVLDAVAAIGGFPKDAKVVWLVRPGANGGADQILPVDWNGITAKGESKTNYQLLPGDRVYVKAEK